VAQISSNGYLDFSNLTFATDPFGLPEASGFVADLSLDSGDFPGVVGTYTSSNGYVYWDGVGAFEDSAEYLGVLGDGFTYDADDMLAGGTVTGILYEGNFDSNSSDYFYILDVSVSAEELLSVGATQSTADDLALLEEMLSGKDTITGSAEADYFFGADGDDSLIGNNGGDTISGDAGKDKIDGGKGTDSLGGGNGNDTILGGEGGDKINGAGGQDQMSAGLDTARDVFVFSALGDSVNASTRDKINEFVSGIDDIDLKKIDANLATGSNEAFAYAGSKASAHSVWWKVSGSDVIVYADVDGNTTADFSVRVAGLTSLTSADFLL
jgi:Ca2+-binding RTX toxin-like protein